MRKLHIRLTAAALVFALPLAMTSVAAAAPALKPVGERPAFEAPVTGKGNLASAGLKIAAIPGALALPASPFADTVAGTPAASDELSADVFSFSLNDGDVLRATITPATDDFLMGAGFTSDADDPNFSFPSSYASGGDRGFDVYIPAEYGADTYYLAVMNPMETSSGYDVAWEIIPGQTQAVVERKAGTDRFAVAEAVGLEAFPGWAGITDVIVACGDDRAMADPLSASGLAGAYGAPILLVKPILVGGKLPVQTERALTNIRNANGGKVNIHVIGGTVSVPPAVYNRVVSFRGTGTHERINGSDRYSLSAAMAKKARDVIVGKGGTVQHVLIANGESSAVFYDALAASTIAYRNGYPMLLTKASSVPSSVQNQLNTTFVGTNRYLVNSPTYLKSAVKTATGALYNITSYNNRFDAAWDIAEWGYMNGLLERDAIAVANKLPDALTGGIAMGEMGGPILYTTTGAAGLDGSTWTFLYWNKGAIKDVKVLGGTVSIDPDTYEEIEWALEWPIVFF